MSWLARWLPPLAWMGLIYFLSTDYLSMPGLRHTWAGFLAAKATHATEYGVLTLLWYRALVGRLEPGNRRAAAWALLAAAGYAVVDEIHQSFTSYRSGNIADVLLDASSALVTLAVFQALPWFPGGPRWYVKRERNIRTPMGSALSSCRNDTDAETAAVGQGTRASSGRR
jgi:VanZ like family